MYRYTKRGADITVALISLALLSILWIAIAIAIKTDSKGPVLFKQLRYGKDEKPFMIYKFRTMADGTPTMATNDFKDAGNYITKVGKIMRKLSLDEVPQFLNVLKGEMSLVGPRPVILAETNLIAERNRYGANAFVPGITGWAQANGRDQIDIYTKARMDGDYASEFGLLMDIRCLFKTVETILFANGYQEGSATTASDLYTYGSTGTASASAAASSVYTSSDVK